MINRKIFFDVVRDSLFNGKLTQAQVDGMNFKLDVWEAEPYSTDLRWLAYPFATSYHETGQRMEPVREGFKETDAEARAFVKAQGYAYAAVDPVTGQVYYGRGDVQTTWADNYKKSGAEIGLGDELYRNPERMLEADISARCMYKGMVEGWYRGDSKGRQTLARYFNATTNDPYGAREIINGDKTRVPSWSNGVSIGKLIAGYHNKFLAALEAAQEDSPAPPVPDGPDVVTVAITAPSGVEIVVKVNEVKL